MDNKEQLAGIGFMKLLSECRTKHSDFVQDCAEEFGVEEAAVKRWEQGIVKPVPVFRARIIAWINEYTKRG
jgi:hypothetical protein